MLIVVTPDKENPNVDVGFTLNTKVEVKPQDVTELVVKPMFALISISYVVDAAKGKPTPNIDCVVVTPAVKVRSVVKP